MSAGATKKLRKANELAQASRLISDFCDCERSPALRVEPTSEALEELLQSCSSLSRSAVADAFHEQLSWASGDLEWQPRLRALFALEHLCKQGSQLSKTLVKKVVREAEGVLRHLEAEVPRCREKASQVLALARLPSRSTRSVVAL